MLARKEDREKKRSMGFCEGGAGGRTGVVRPGPLIVKHCGLDPWTCIRAGTGNLLASFNKVEVRVRLRSLSERLIVMCRLPCVSGCNRW